MNLTIGKRIQSLRKQKGMSQQDLADYLNMSRQAVSKWELDQTLPDLETLVKMAELFNISINELIGVEANEKTISEAYDQIQIVLQNIQKNDRIRSIIQLMMMIVCIISLVLTASMKNNVEKQLNDTSNKNTITTNTITDFLYNKNEELSVQDFKYIRWQDILMYATHYDLENWTVLLDYQFSLYEYTPKTTMQIEFSNIDTSITYDLNKTEENLFTLNERIPIENYTSITVYINDGKGNIKTEDVDYANKGMFLQDVLNKYLNLSIPLDDKGNLKLNTISFETTYDPNLTKLFKGNLIGTLTLSILENNMVDIKESVSFSLDKASTTTLKEKLPINQPIYVAISYEYLNKVTNDMTTVTIRTHHNSNADNIFTIPEGQHFEYRILGIPN